MKRFSKFFQESTELDEAVEVSHDRYMRSHGKKASGGHGTWMFTHKRMGDVNVDSDKEVHAARGKFSDAKKSAQQWAKRHGHSTVYVMEEVEQIDEISKETKAAYLKKAPEDHYQMFTGRKPGTKQKLDKRRAAIQKVSKELTGKKHFSDYDPKTKKYTNEEVNLDEVSDKKLDAYRQKAFADQPSGDDCSDKYRKRKFGRDLAFAKQTGRAKVLATKEETEQIDEISQKTLRSYMDKAGTQRLSKSKEAASHFRQAGMTGSASDTEKGMAAAKVANKRAKGYETAFSKNLSKVMKKEEADRIDEIAKEYYAVHRAASLSSAQMKGAAPGDQPSFHKTEADAINHLNKKYKKVRDGVWKDSKGQFFFHKKHSSVKEEVELDEVSTKMLRNYLSKANADMASINNKAEDEPDSTKRRSLYKRLGKRRIGTSLARGKLTGEPYKKNPGVDNTMLKAKIQSEEVEQIDELKKSTLGSYIKKASARAVSDKTTADRLNRRAFDTDNRGDSEKYFDASDRMQKKYKNRLAGIAKATDRLTKEEVEQIDEYNTKSSKAIVTKDDKPVAIYPDLKSAQKDYYGKDGHAVGMRSHSAAERIRKANPGIKIVESVEQIDELKRSTLSSYLNKSMKSKDKADGRSFKDTVLGKPPRDEKTFTKRRRGINTAINKLSGSYVARVIPKEEVEQIDEVSKKTAISAYRKRQRHADDWYSEPDDQKKADATLRRISKKFNSKTTGDAQHGVDIDRKGRGPRDVGQDYLFYKQDTYDRLAKPGTKKGTSQRKDYMKLNKGTFKKPPRFTEEVERIDEISADLAHDVYKKRMDQAKAHVRQDNYSAARKAEKKAGETSLRMVKKILRREETELDNGYIESTNESVEMSMNQRKALEIGRKLQMMATKEKNDTIANAMANLGDHLESFGATFGPKNMSDLMKKTGLTKEAITMLIQRAQRQ